MGFGDIEGPEQDRSYVEATQKMVEGSTATQVGAKYVAEYYRTLIAEGIPLELARDLTRDFAKGMVIEKVHQANGVI